jgi:membrane-associated protease RseP (regulator of RpoE activity)
LCFPVDNPGNFGNEWKRVALPAAKAIPPGGTMFRAMCVLSAVAVVALGGAVLAAPVPAERPPDPLARAAVGIQADTNLAITTVYEGMPAARAGVKVGDKIVRIGGLRPQVFDQVIAHICSYRPGSQVEFEVDRGGEKIVFKVKLVPRPESFGNPDRLPGSPPPLGGPPDN